ncbi:MAG: hypothetical protein V2A55_03660 [Candidatus Jorgensenbacteria bacterium]
MKRAIFFGTKDSAWVRKAFHWVEKKIISSCISVVLVAVGIITPVRGLFPMIAVADDRPPYQTAEVILTAYSSSVDETDNTPFITASGATVEDGIIANNCLSYGTEVQIPELFGDKIFIVQDRKHSRYSCNWVDVWYPSKQEAEEFGITRGTEMLIFD